MGGEELLSSVDGAANSPKNSGAIHGTNEKRKGWDET
jgi:hypothetical protein